MALTPNNRGSRSNLPVLPGDYATLSFKAPAGNQVTFLNPVPTPLVILSNGLHTATAVALVGLSPGQANVVLILITDKNGGTNNLLSGMTYGGVAPDSFSVVKNEVDSSFGGMLAIATFAAPNFLNSTLSVTKTSGNFSGDLHGFLLAFANGNVNGNFTWTPPPVSREAIDLLTTASITADLQGGSALNPPAYGIAVGWWNDYPNPSLSISGFNDMTAAIQGQNNGAFIALLPKAKKILTDTGTLPAVFDYLIVNPPTMGCINGVIIDTL